VVKIDRSFMRGLGAESPDTESRDARNPGAEGRRGMLVSAMIPLIRKLGYRVVAEGVETQAVCDTLSRLGCDEIQGFLIARPMPAPAFERWLAGADGACFRPDGAKRTA
jgi:EAL domain-containing protein (putative c-di-GMP-specific phosphodiesterase class I)